MIVRVVLSHDVRLLDTVDISGDDVCCRVWHSGLVYFCLVLCGPSC